ncbi:glycosyltransferase family A protein [Streptomyces sp. NPDC005423]|uniref:glycosyltransferase family A protein n=1 Tax=Streptomyces sp. NPDC005423 TaxID=3155343 RepID=UPI0033B67D9C
MSVKVSVVVPVYNPGPYIEECVSSLLRQSLPAEEFEAIFVDDGSTDGTPARLDELAALHPHLHVIHQEPSGWSGKPRNVGIAAAQGEFVMFVDNDDYLGDEALERMYDYGVANGADVIVGKMAGKGRAVPVELFRRNRPRASVENAPLIDSLTPHKMLRRAFLDRIGLRFPEGRRRLEDHVFVTEAYLRAENVSVLADYVCYYHIKRDDAANAGFQRFDPVGYFGNLREALDVVEKYTEPGPVRDRLFRRWLRVEMVERMGGRRLLAAPEEYRRALLAEMRQVMAERFGPGVAAGLPPRQRVIAALMAADRYDDLVALAEWDVAVRPRAIPTADPDWHDGALRLGFTVQLTGGAGDPMVFPADGASAAGQSAPEDLAAAKEWLTADARATFGRATADLVLRERTSAASHFQPVEVTHERVPAGDGAVRLVLRVAATVDAATAAGAGPLGSGIWDAHVRVTIGGWTKECRLGPVPRAGANAGHAGVVDGHVVLPYWTAPHGNFSLDIDRAGKRLGLGGLQPGDVSVTDGRLSTTLPFHVPAATDVLLRLTAKASGTALDVPGTLSPGDASGARLEAQLPLAAMEKTARRVTLCLAPAAPEPRFLALPVTLTAGAGGVRVRGAESAAPRLGFLRRAVRGLRRALRARRRGTAS